MRVAGDGRRRCGLLRGDQDFRGGRMDVRMERTRRGDDYLTFGTRRIYSSGSGSSSGEAAHDFIHLFYKGNAIKLFLPSRVEQCRRYQHSHRDRLARISFNLREARLWVYRRNSSLLRRFFQKQAETSILV